MAKVHYNRLSKYAGENGGRVLLLFLLFLLSIYSFINSGITGMATVAMSPLIIVFIYLAFKNRMFTFWMLFFVNYFLMFLNREGYLPIPVSLPNELLELVLIAIAIIDLRESNFDNLANLMTLGIVGWCAFCVLEVLNDTCGLGININAWFNGIRLIAFLLLYIVIVFALYITTPKRLYQLIFCWACLCIFADYWSWQQQNIGFTQAETSWLYGYAYRTHLVNGITRYWSIFSDAACFGVHMAAASTAFFIIAITNKVKKYKIFFLIVGILSTWQMFASGTRTSIYCMIAGFALFLVLSKSVKIIAPVSVVFGLFLCMLIFTNIGQGNAQIRRMRSGFNKNDASANVRDMNKFHEQILDIDDFESFANINSETMLEFRRVNTKVVKNEKIHSESIKILSTGREINYATMNINGILSSIISENLYNDYTEFIRPNLYSKEFMKTLKKLDIENVISDVKNMDKLPWSLQNMDSLNIYITAFANTYKK